MKSCAVLLLAALCAGCAAEPSPPPASGSSAARRPVAWQQFCEQVWSMPQANAVASSRGADGWELVAIYNGVMCFKRPLGDADTPARTSLPPSNIPAVRDPGF